MFEVILRFQNDALQAKLEQHFGTTNLAAAIKRTLRDVVVSKRVQKHHAQSEAAWKETIQQELEAIQTDTAAEFEDGGG